MAKESSLPTCSHFLGQTFVEKTEGVGGCYLYGGLVVQLIVIVLWRRSHFALLEGVSISIEPWESKLVEEEVPVRCCIELVLGR